MDFLKIIQESRVDEFKSKYAQKFTPENANKIAGSVAPKFLEWVGRVFDGINFDENFPNLVNALEKFEKISSNLPRTDINQYKSFGELISEINNYENRVRRDVRKVEGGNVVFDDGRYFIVNPLTHDSSCYYGKGTKWCTAAETDSNFTRYNEDGKLFYILDRTKSTNDPYYKIAILKKFNGEVLVYDAVDNQMKSLSYVIDEGKSNEINEAVDSYLNQQFPEQIKIWKDKELAIKERERLNRLAIQRREAQMRIGAEQRREDGEWELGPDCPEVGLKAHALLDWLVDTSDVEVMTPQDRADIQRINGEIDELQAQYDTDEEVRTDLLDEISDLEDERDELESKIDVYDIIPVGSHYNLTQFEVIDNPDVEGRTYAVGDDDEMQTSCYDYVDNLIDDIGYKGFSSGFAQSYIDENEVKSRAEDIYDGDVRDNPDSYFNDDERQLSDEQEDKIEILNYRIKQTEDIIENLEGRLDGGDEDEKIEEKIEELKELIIEYQEEIEEEEENPSGEFPDDIIDDKIRELVNEAVNDYDYFFETFGLEWDDFIDKDDFIQGVIDSDGYGSCISSYDGNADEVYVDNKLFYVIRID